MITSFKEFQKQNPKATFFEYLDAMFPVIKQGTFGEDFFFDDGLGGVTLFGPADNNDITVHGDVGFVTNHDGWNNEWRIEGDIESVAVALSIGTSVSALDVEWASAYESSNLDFSFTTVDDIVWNGVDGSSLESLITGDLHSQGDSNNIDLGFWAGQVDIVGDDNIVTAGQLENGTVDGNGNDIFIDYLTKNLSVTGHGNDVSIGDADGASITIAYDALNTSVSADGDAFVFDFGDSTSLRAGQGDQIVYAFGDGTSMYNGGEPGLLDQILDIPDQDAFFDYGGGKDIISGFGTVEVNTDGDVVILDGTPEELWVNIGDHAIDGEALMRTFGYADRADAVLDFNGGSLTLVGAADGFNFPTEDFLLAGQFLCACH